MSNEHFTCVRAYKLEIALAVTGLVIAVLNMCWLHIAPPGTLGLPIMISAVVVHHWRNHRAVSRQNNTEYRCTSR